METKITKKDFPKGDIRKCFDVRHKDETVNTTEVFKAICRTLMLLRSVYKDTDERAYQMAKFLCGLHERFSHVVTKQQHDTLQQLMQNIKQSHINNNSKK